jgi:uncharacterized protein (DUF1697 family)/enamine deaminase RidA (YjgF/YER057c/UK114 family)
MASYDARAAELGLTLHGPHPPHDPLDAVVVHGGVARTSGQLPRIEGRLTCTGTLGKDVTVEDGAEAARVCVLNALAVLRAALGSLDRIERVLSMTGYVACVAGFDQQPAVMDGASQVLYDLFGSAGRHTRSAIGVAALPRRGAVELELTVAVRRSWRRPVRTHLALLRGINVGGRNKVAMAELRQVVASLGHREVATYIQSGNVVFAAADAAADTSRLAEELEVAIATQLAVAPAVVVVSGDELRQVVRDNPYPDEPNPRAVHAVFLRAAPAPEAMGAVAEAVSRAKAGGARDEARLIGRTLYLWTPDGLGRSRLAADLLPLPPKRHLGVIGTARNWATVTKLVGLLA